MAKVSIVIPCYNVEKYIEECLDSVINQTLKNIEIICVDDGSTDNTGKIIDKYAQKDCRIKVIHKQNSGYGASMNVGLTNATGDYIGIVEPDDYIELDMFEVLYDKAIQTGVDFVKSDFYEFDESMVQNHRKLDWQGVHYNRIINPKKEKTIFHIEMNTWTGIYKRDFINSNNIRYNETPGARYQDQGFWFQSMMYANAVYIINKPFYHYRFFQTNSTNNPNGFSWIQKEYEYIYNLLEQKRELYNEFIFEYNCFKFIHYLFNYIKLDKKIKKENLKFFRETFLTIRKNGEFDETLLNDYERKMYNLLIKNSQKFYRKLTNSLSLFEKLFSVKNKIDGYTKTKTLRFFGIKIRLKKEILIDLVSNMLIENKSKIVSFQNRINEQQGLIDRLNHINTIQTFGFYNGDDFVKSYSLGESFVRQIDNDDFYRLCNKYFAFRELKEFHPHEVLIYINACLNTNRIEKAQNLLNEFVNIFGLDEIWRFLPVAKFAKEQGITDENIEKAAFVFNKLEENRKNKLFEKLVEGKTIAVVGNGPSEIGKGKGAEIDSHDIVIRINNYQTKGFEQDYGSKTDIWVKCSSDDIEHELRDENIQLIVYEPDYKRHVVIDGYMEALNDSLREIDYFDYEDHVKLRKKLNLFPSTGLVLAEKLLTCCNVAKLDLYGFSFLADCKNKNMKIHYYNTDKCEIEAKKRCSHHSFQKESEYLRKALNV